MHFSTDSNHIAFDVFGPVQVPDINRHLPGQGIQKTHIDHPWVFGDHAHGHLEQTLFENVERLSQTGCGRW